MGKFRDTLPGWQHREFFDTLAAMIRNASAILSLSIFVAPIASFVGTASAASLVVSEQGTWASACPTPLCASQSDTWGYSFDISSNPSSFPTSTVGQFTLVPISGFEFYDNGIVVPAMSNSQTGMYFYNINYGGGFGGGLSNLNTPLDILAANGAQLYHGSENSPSFSPGTFAPGVVTLGIDNVTLGHTNPGPIVITAVPEPKTGLLLGLGCLSCFVGLIARERNDYRKMTRVSEDEIR
jgi:hypothetical protein